MAEDVQRLLLQIDASATLLRQEVAKARADVDSFADKTERSANRAGSALERLGGAGFGGVSKMAGFAAGGIAGFVSALSVGGVLSFSRAVLEMADDLSTAADQAGIAVERYQSLKEGLRALEIDGNQADKMFRRLIDTLGAVQGGTAGKAVTEALERMGVQARILNGEVNTTDELFDAIASSAGNYATEAQYVADVSAIVGSKLGPQLAAALKDGGAALQASEQAFRQAGGVISEEYVAKLADANERIDSFVTRAKASMMIFGADTLSFFERVGAGIDSIFGRIDSSSRDSLTAAQKRLRQQVTDLEAGTFGFLPVAPQAIANAKRSLASVDQQLADMDMADTVNRFPLNSRGSFGALPKIASPAKPKKTKGKAVKEFTAANMESGFELRQLLEAGTPAKIEVTNQALQGIASTLGELKSYDFEINLIGQEQIALADDFTRSLSSGLAQAILNGQSLGDALINSIKAAASELISSGLLNLLSGGKRGVSFGESISAVTSLFGGARATGGSVMPGKAYVVGEKRPELFVPSTSGYIMPRLPSGQGGGGQQSVNVTVNPSPLFITTVAQGAQAAAQETLRKSTRQRMPQSAGV
jgi:hypothetical protein